MVKIIDAIELCNERVKELQQKVYSLNNTFRKLQFCIINASDDKGNERYIQNKIKLAEEIGIDAIVHKFDKDCTDDDILKLINECNEKWCPVILQLPIYEHLDKEKLLDAIDYMVDADGFTREWIGEVNLGNDELVCPATPKGVISLLKYHNIDLQGKNVLVIGSSNHVSKPLLSMILKRGGTILNANINTQDLNSLIRISDVIISCVGKPNLIKPEVIKDGCVLIGVGFTYIDRKQILDFDIDEIVKDGRASIVTNRINCTGKTTVLSLMENVITLYQIYWSRHMQDSCVTSFKQTIDRGIK